MRIAICEGDKTERGQIIAYIQRELVSKHMIAEICSYESGEILLSSVGQKPFDIYFLNVLLSGINGIDVARILRRQDKRAAIVFVASGKEYCMEGFEVGAAHYLLKPYSQDLLQEALRRSFRQVGTGAKYLELIVNRTKQRILLTKIYWIESLGKVCHLHMEFGEVCSYISLSQMEQMLGDFRFLRCHRSFIVNLDYVDKMADGFFCMADGMHIPVRQKERAYFRKIYEDYFLEKISGGVVEENVKN